MPDVVIDEAVDEDEYDGGCIALIVSLESAPGQQDARDDDGLPLHWFKFDWLNPQQLLAIAKDLAEADGRDDDVRAVLQAWQRADLDGMLMPDDDE